MTRLGPTLNLVLLVALLHQSRRVLRSPRTSPLASLPQLPMVSIVLDASNLHEPPVKSSQTLKGNALLVSNVVADAHTLPMPPFQTLHIYLLVGSPLSTTSRRVGSQSTSSLPTSARRREISVFRSRLNTTSDTSGLKNISTFSTR